MAIMLAILAGLVTAAMLFYLLFDDWEEWVECVKFCFTPDIISLFQGKWLEDSWAEIKILIWLGLSVAVGILTYVNVQP